MLRRTYLPFLGTSSQRQLYLAPLYYLHVYEGDVRQTLLQAKVHGSHEALSEILRKASPYLHQLTTQHKLSAATPAPSSLWSRLHGCFDVAYALADHMQKHQKISLKEMPWSYHWRWRKRAYQKKIYAPREELVAREELASSSLPAVLIIDDIATTGTTLAKLAAAKHAGGAPIVCFSYAVSRKYIDNLKSWESSPSIPPSLSPWPNRDRASPV